MPSLLVTEGPLAGQPIEFDSALVLGRDGADMDIEDQQLSRRHARFRFVDDAVQVEDLESLNGTWVNGVRIAAPTRLQPGDAVRIGLTVLELQPEPVRAPVTVVSPGLTPPAPADAARDRAERELDRLMFRLAGIGSFGGIVLYGPAQLLHPLPEADVATSFLEEITTTSYWIHIHLASLFGFFAGLLIFLGLYRSIREPLARLFATVGLVFVVIGTAFIISWIAIDGVAMKRIADDWLTAPPGEKAAAFRVANGIEDIIFAYFSLAWVMWFGLPFVFFGIAVALNEPRRAWLGWAGAVAGAMAFVVGLIQVYTFRDFLVTDVLIPISGVLTSIWIIAMGLLLWRRASKLADPRASPDVA